MSAGVPSRAMAGSSTGRILVLTTAGESHGPAEVAILDGVPPGLPLTPADFAHDLGRRRPGQSKLVTQRQEADAVEILSGVFEGVTTGTALALLVKNEDARSKDYTAIADKFRPGHADWSYFAKYGVRDHRGGGRASARETVMRVAAGVVAKKILGGFGVRVLAYTRQVGAIVTSIDPTTVGEADVEATPVRCPDPAVTPKMIEAIEAARNDRDSIGGVAQIVATGVPAGWGEPVFDKLEADLAKALFSVPAVVGVELGAGFAAAAMRGSEHDDRFTTEEDRVVTTTNHHGGVLGGISTGMPILIRAALKPASSIPQPLDTVTTELERTTVTTKGRHDPCLVPRFIPIAEAVVAWVLADHALRQRAQVG
ncbi:MAG: chorismate synthase [Deltaproteobacteria bacterium]